MTTACCVADVTGAQVVAAVTQIPWCAGVPFIPPLPDNPDVMVFDDTVPDDTGIVMVFDETVPDDTAIVMIF